ncbi:hypothetical protein [Mycobacterium ostraviense]|uniref:hypothetical protein n=1 Tax=Mycobacterium ostraviense TaxID=2738409 RepID=UPI00115678A4|nr:hypothetical protein [Mycobacterium ostraviense]
MTDSAARLGRAHGLSLWQVALCDETSPLVPSASARVDDLVSVFAAVFRRTGQRDLAALPDARVLASTAVTASASRVVVGRVVSSDRVVGAVA